MYIHTNTVKNVICYIKNVKEKISFIRIPHQTQFQTTAAKS